MPAAHLGYSGFLPDGFVVRAIGAGALLKAPDAASPSSRRKVGHSA